MPLTVTHLARACGLSRSTVLYYESIGLLQSAGRSAGNYRVYGERDLQRLRQICIYRGAGVKLGDIRSILDGPQSDAAGVLKRRLVELSGEIERLREHQTAIARLLKDTDQLRRLPMVTKEKWTEIMRGAGFTNDDMHRWHAEFEKSAPQEHQEFLEFLHIPQEEVKSIREWSRGSHGGTDDRLSQH
ncbi:MAG: MerR family transcriptional regulator [Acidobacteriia bacterium]|nr:MerR family transcriptional regulator [Terriglobia bacterium]